ncbi:MAG TPA: AraC family transcriptional regulator [Stenotrophomonas sp.]|jgi:AraC-like DNA-binding protein
MSEDILSDVLRALRLRSALFYYVTCGGDWIAQAPASRDIAAAVMPDADQVMEYHVVTAGECWAAIDGQSPLKLRRGDVLMLPQGDAHVLSSAPGKLGDPDIDWYYEMQQQQRPFLISLTDTLPAGEPPAATLVCGFIGCDLRPFNPLIATLPRMLHLPASHSSGWGEQFVQQAVLESGHRRPGSEAILERLSEMLFVDAVRRHLETLPDQSKGWLAGLRDRHVGRALTLLHGAPSADWSMDELGRQVGLSRSALHERFVELIGQPPMQYLAHWRMQLASRLLRDTPASVLTIALRVGYDSEATFGRAFKRMVGLPPATWRRRQTRVRDASVRAE